MSGLAPYCLHRMRAEMTADIAAGAARIAHANKNSGLWKSAVKCAQAEWGLVRYSAGMAALVAGRASIKYFSPLAL